MLKTPKTNHIFKDGSSLKNVFNLYCFDRELRKLILGEIEKIEVAVRARMIYTLSQTNGPFWFNDSNLFQNTRTFGNTNLRFTKDFDDSDEEFIKNFKLNYSDNLPPSWMMLEITSFGSLSIVYKNLKASRDKRYIANYFGVNESTFQSWLHSIVYIRNVCAHHGRLWNRNMSIAPGIPTSPINSFIKITTLPNPDITQPPIDLNNRTYYILSMIIYLLNIINPNHSFKSKLYYLLKKYPMIDVKAMGFPEGWEKEDLWNWEKVRVDQKWYSRFKLYIRKKYFY
jgi:abortive infection bacteriophage resistance protein